MVVFEFVYCMREKSRKNEKVHLKKAIIAQFGMKHFIFEFHKLLFQGFFFLAIS